MVHSYTSVYAEVHFLGSTMRFVAQFAPIWPVRCFFSSCFFFFFFFSCITSWHVSIGCYLEPGQSGNQHDDCSLVVQSNNKVFSLRSSQRMPAARQSIPKNRSRVGDIHVTFSPGSTGPSILMCFICVDKYAISNKRETSCSWFKPTQHCKLQ